MVDIGVSCARSTCRPFTILPRPLLIAGYGGNQTGIEPSTRSYYQEEACDAFSNTRAVESDQTDGKRSLFSGTVASVQGLLS